MTLEQLSAYHDLSSYVVFLKSEVADLRSSNSLNEHLLNKKEIYLKSMIRLCETERERIFAFVTQEVAERDCLVASIMYWRFIRFLPWSDVGAHCHLKGNTCYQMVKRYIRKYG